MTQPHPNPRIQPGYIAVVSTYGAIVIVNGSQSICIIPSQAEKIAKAILVAAEHAKQTLHDMTDRLRAAGWRWEVTDSDKHLGRWVNMKSKEQSYEIMHYVDATSLLYQNLFVSAEAVTLPSQN